ncbi:alanine racemase [Acuticoccus sp. M5D2P5]|uniref:alanine racemase n=1 Tax=Acuticoccus kalidii TaxID=2910977 RepID=UPI001F20CCDD|nr:alanine racemase [Acuticoccus kalidii]MCF3934591.1 alanine racemase [Acuticoccus kalidii]
MIPRLDLSSLDALPLDPSTKGLPFGAVPPTVGAVADEGWRILEEDLPLPLAVIREDILAANSRWMAAFTAANDLVIAPHGKTTMAPALFDLQIADGAWGITVATVQQLEVCRRFGVKRVLLANQPTGPRAIEACFAALAADASFELYCLADGADGLARLAEAAQRMPTGGNPLRILVEVGFTGGRTGARTEAGALALARTVAATDGLALAGFECFEGLLPTPDEAAELVAAVTRSAEAATRENLFPADVPVIVSAGGSAFFDRVGERFAALSLDRPLLKVIRSGCYLTHDAIGYAAAFERIRRETSLTLPDGGLEPALEVWAYVQSCPEAQRTMLTMGKRDVGFDAGFPVPTRWFRPGPGMTAPEPMPAGHEVVALNDQHCHLVSEAPTHLQVGDMVAFGIGHPCTTFDKWALLLLVDETYRVTGALRTFF